MAKKAGSKPSSDQPERLARALAAALPPPRQSTARTNKVLIVLNDEELKAVVLAAQHRGAPLAPTIRDLAVTYARLLTGGG